MIGLRILCRAFVLSAAGFSLAHAAPVIQSDICVYGATSGGVAAAVAAARLGKNVVLISINNHVGGMTSGGLGVTDVGNASTIGGIAGEFYSRVGQYYGSSQPVYYFEPHVAEQTYWQMTGQAGVAVCTNEQLASVTMSNLLIKQITMADGTTYRASEFIDSTYEGDLMAMAGVNFTWGRESSAQYNESLAGIQNPTHAYSYDPYVTPGQPSSGLLPFMQSAGSGSVGQGDHLLQCYNFRLCLTQNSTNQIPIAPPTNYVESNYELFRRYIAARIAHDGSVSLGQLMDIQTIIPNGKTDINANGELSTDYLGGNAGYATNTPAARQAIWQAHADYIRGFLHFLATSTNVPASLNSAMQSWGLAKDEFQDTGGWPPQLYVREARRMVSDYVMLQQDAQGSRAATDPIALASYTLDSHPVERVPNAGLAMTEGGIGVSVSYPFPVSYRSIIPSTNNQCQNLFCTFALSASHVGFASIRLEPPFMMTSQSAGTAAAFAIDDHVPVQQMNYPKLSAELRADNQILTWSCPLIYLTNTITLSELNNCYVTTSGGWSVGANSGGWPPPNGPYWHDGATGKGTKWVDYTPVLPTNGLYGVYLWWVAASNRATNTPVDIISASGTTRVYVNQQINGSAWVNVLTTNFNAGSVSSVIIRNDGTASGTYCIANGVQWRPVGFSLPAPPATAPPAVEIVASDAVACEFPTNTARFSVVRNNDPNLLAMPVTYTISGTASNGVDYAALSGTVTIPAGVLATNIIVTPLGDSLATNQVTVTLSLVPSTNYTLTSVSNATATILDWPINIWRRANFTSAELADPTISGDLAEPAHDGLANLLKYALGLAPKVPAFAPLAPALGAGKFAVSYTKSLTAIDVSLDLEWSSDLVTWQSGPAYFQQLSAVDQGAVELITMQGTAPVSATSQGFVRLRASRL
jgi:hypothetical protein